ncbi:MAG: bifunctional UDP-N-acetylglucosamine diphosphorylase/glucosamine-1-phosphate N-acetyltransferase GlmU [Chloroflexi bacterium]|nr:bifunctional UDP-N-acetylglucosamine diphosphorylase/glucosamine-1-phosphate N-acetyltransferase GlmU [Chloroflexota bacterium]
MKIAAIVLAAGEGTRMHSAIPKVLHPLAGEPMLKHVLRAVSALKPQPLVVVGPRGRKMLSALGPSKNYRYVEQRQPRGTGHAVLQTERAVAGKADMVLVIYSDHPLTTPQTIKRLIEAHQAEGAVLSFLAFHPSDPSGYGRVLRDDYGQVRAIVEEAAASEEEKKIGEAVSGVLVFDDSWLWPNLGRIKPNPKNGEIFLTDLISLALSQGQGVAAPLAEDNLEATGINTRLQLAQAEAVMRERVQKALMLSGVTILDPASTFIDTTVSVGPDTVILPATIIQGHTKIGSRCRLGPQTRIIDSSIGDGCTVDSSTLEEAILAEGVQVGPYSHLRPGTKLGKGVHVGNYVEIKESTIGDETQIGHFSYIGDAKIGKEVNIGAGSITCNFDGVKKQRTVIGDGAFIGSDTMLVAPVRVGRGAKTGAGAVVTHNLPPGSLAYGVPARVMKKKG